jgi:hypothetical protein
MNTDAILDALRAEVPVEIYRRNEYELLRSQQRGSCVQATRMGIEALRYFGVHAKPLVTLLMVGNAAWVDWMADPDRSPDNWPDDVWSVGTDPVPGKERGYPAHLVIEIDGMLLDLDTRFAARPEKGIHVPDTLYLPIRPEGMSPDLLAGTPLDEGGIALYRPHTPKVDFHASGAWKDSRKWSGPVIRRMRERLNHAA